MTKKIIICGNESLGKIVAEKVAKIFNAQRENSNVSDNVDEKKDCYTCKHETIKYNDICADCDDHFSNYEQSDSSEA